MARTIWHYTRAHGRFPETWALTDASQYRVEKSGQFFAAFGPPGQPASAGIGGFLREYDTLDAAKRDVVARVQKMAQEAREMHREFQDARKNATRRHRPH